MARKNVKIRRRLLILGFPSIMLIVYLIISVGGTISDIMTKKQEQDYYENLLVDLSKEEEYVSNQLEKLRDPDYVARYAREKYLYSKDGEFIIKIE